MHVLAEHGEAKDLDDGEDDGEYVVDGHEEEAHDEPRHEHHQRLQPPDVDGQQLPLKLFSAPPTCVRVRNLKNHL
jgi:hypothetical protein